MGDLGGQEVDLELEGFHIKDFSNGLYQGDFLLGMLHGRGKFIFNNTEVYVGEWRNNKMHGQGCYTYADGSRYEGVYKDGKKHGIGTYTLPSGESYVAEFENGVAVTEEGGTAKVIGPDGKETVIVIAPIDRPRRARAQPAPPPEEEEEDEGEEPPLPPSSKERGHFSEEAGLGIVMRGLPGGGGFVSGIAPGGAAQQTGEVEIGDRIVEVGGRDVRNYDLLELGDLATGPRGSKVEVVTERGGGEDELLQTRRLLLVRGGGAGDGGEGDTSRLLEAWQCHAPERAAAAGWEEEGGAVIGYDEQGGGVGENDDGWDDGTDGFFESAVFTRSQGEYYGGMRGAGGGTNVGGINQNVEDLPKQLREIKAHGQLAKAHHDSSSNLVTAHESFVDKQSPWASHGGTEFPGETSFGGSTADMNLGYHDERVWHKSKHEDEAIFRVDEVPRGAHGASERQGNVVDQEMYDPGMTREAVLARTLKSNHEEESDSKKLPAHVVEFILKDRGTFAKISDNKDLRADLYYEFARSVSKVTLSPLSCVSVSEVWAQPPNKMEYEKGELRIKYPTSEKLRKEEVDEGQITSRVRIHVALEMHKEGLIEDIVTSFQTALAELLVFRFEKRDRVFFTQPYIKDAVWCEIIGRENDSELLQAKRAAAIGEMGAVLPSHDLHETYARTLRQELFKSQEESKAVWSENFMKKYGNPHLMVMDTKEQQRLVFLQREKINEDIITHTSIFKVVKRLTRKEDGDRVLVIDRSNRVMRNEIPRKEELTDTAAAEGNRKIRENEESGEKRKEIPFSNFKLITEDPTVETHLTIDFRGNQRTFEVWFMSKRERAIFVEAVRRMVPKTCFPIPDRLEVDAGELAQRHKVNTRAVIKYDAAGHPMRNLSSAFVGKTDHPLQDDESHPAHVFVPSNAKTPGLSNQQSAYVVARSAVSAQYYGDNVLQQAIGIEQQLEHSVHREVQKSESIASGGRSSMRDTHSVTSHSKSQHALSAAQSLGGFTPGKSRATGKSEAFDLEEEDKTEFTSSDHIIGYKLLHGIDRQLSKNEVLHAVTAKYADRLLKAEVMGLIEKDQELRDVRKELYKRMIKEKNIKPTPENMKKIEKEVGVIMENKRFYKMMQESVMGTQKEVLAHPVAFVLPPEDQERLNKNSGPENIKFARRCYHTGTTMDAEKARQKEREAQERESSYGEGTSVAGSRTGSRKPSASYAGSRKPSATSSFHDGDDGLGSRRASSAGSDVTSQRSVAVTGGVESLRQKRQQQSSQGQPKHMLYTIATKDLRARQYHVYSGDPNSGGTLFMQISASGGVLTGGETFRMVGANGREIGGLRAVGAPVKCWYSEGHAELTKLEDAVVDVGVFTLERSDGDPLLLNVEVEGNAMRWYDQEGEVRIAQMDLDAGMSKWTLELSSEEIRRTGEQNVVPALVASAIASSMFGQSAMDSVLQGRLW